MQNYLKSIDLARITASESTKAMLQKLISSGELARDIDESPYVEGKCGAVRVDAKACTEIGQLKKPIRFDVSALAEELNDISGEVGLIRLTALAFHEHVHHFQNARDGDETNEAQANAVAAYVQLTARFAQLPTLTWAMPGESLDINHQWRLVSDLPNGTKLTLFGLKVFIPANVKHVELLSRPIGDQALVCNLLVQASEVDRVLAGDAQFTRTAHDESHTHSYNIGSNQQTSLNCYAVGGLNGIDGTETVVVKALELALNTKGIRYSLEIPKPVVTGF